MAPKRKYANGDIVLCGYQKLKMMIIDATLCVKGWRYKLAFQKKDRSRDKRRECRFFFENEIIGEGAAIEILVHNGLDQNEWLRGTCLGIVAALDREYRVNCIITDGPEISEAAPECIRLPKNK